MPSFTDIYGITRHRNQATIDRFLAMYVDRAAEEQRDGEELMVEPLDKSPGVREQFDAVEWVPVQTLTDAINFGLARPPRCFALYLHHMRKPGVGRVILAFNRDDQLGLGLCVEEPSICESREPSDDERTAWQEQVRTMLLRLMQDFDCHIGVAGYEYPPPSEEAECFTDADVGRAFLLVQRSS